MNIAIVILAAGSASRMGSIKQLLPYKDISLLQNAINQAVNSKANKVYCVLGAHAKTIQKRIISCSVGFILNPNWEKGLSSSIVSSMQYLQSLTPLPNGVLIMLADQPNVDTNYINNLIQLFNTHKSKVVVSAYKNLNGVPAIFPSVYYKELLNLKGDKGAKSFLNSNANNIIRFIPKANKLVDIDTQEDYQNLIKSLNIK
ncbi:nucleotidyltransferase family protein [Algibacter sp. PT7-4]|uniref:nucleotidyltransferase family protein n=1 Tax=Algibacter ulvanivorans TaxID=3400999 RepID=UPI003AAF5F8A